MLNTIRFQDFPASIQDELSPDNICLKGPERGERFMARGRRVFIEGSFAPCKFRLYVGVRESCETLK
jgi:hypothetical protein